MLEPEIPLVDVIALSKNHCKTPIIGDLKYTHPENFVGRAIKGYDENIRDVCLLATQAAHMLCHVQNHLSENFGVGLLIFDAYRPLRAVKDFVRWFDEPPNSFELERKKIHYPTHHKHELAQLGYIADKVSNHCYGQAVDLTLIDLDKQQELNMGTCFDFFGDLSHAAVTDREIGIEAYQNRRILFDAMHAFHFKVHPKEYWHFDFQTRENTEPLDIEITPHLRGLGATSIRELLSKGNI